MARILEPIVQPLASFARGYGALDKLSRTQLTREVVELRRAVSELNDVANVFRQQILANNDRNFDCRRELGALVSLCGYEQNPAARTEIGVPLLIKKEVA